MDKSSLNRILYWIQYTQLSYILLPIISYIATTFHEMTHVVNRFNGNFKNLIISRIIYRWIRGAIVQLILFISIFL